jgi:hypothetical protein
MLLSAQRYQHARATPKDATLRDLFTHHRQSESRCMKRASKEARKTLRSGIIAPRGLTRIAITE